MKQNMLGCLSSLPKKILSLHGAHNLTEFVLHELCSQDCFNLSKAAYLVDNPDFDCCRGVAGFNKSEAYSAKDLWEAPEMFMSHMSKACFNKKVKEIVRKSMTKNHSDVESLLNQIGAELEIQHPCHVLLRGKHDNHAILLYEKTEDIPSELLTSGLSLLNLCPN